MASKIEATFEFEIGELVYFRAAPHCRGRRPKRFCIVERIARDCGSGGYERSYLLGGSNPPSEASEIELTREEPEYRPATDAEIKDQAQVASAMAGLTWKQKPTH